MLERGEWVDRVDRSTGSGGGRSASISRKLCRRCAPASAPCNGGAAHDPSWRCSGQATASALLLRVMRLFSILGITPVVHAHPWLGYSRQLFVGTLHALHGRNATL